MTMHTEAGPRLTPRQISPVAAPALLAWISIVILSAAAIVLRNLLAANTDVSWLLTVGERVLGGQRLYVDVFETNPPMAVLVYLPGIVIARALGLPAEIVTDSLMFAGIFVSLAIVARTLKDSSVLDGANSWLLAPLAFAILAILPMQSFGQREHIAIVELLPLLAVLAVRMKGEVPSGRMAAIAGCGAGFAVSFKPHFAIAILCAVGCHALYTRSWKAVFAPENLVAAAVVLLYGAGVVAFFPEFFTVIGPVVRDVYLPVGVSFQGLLEKPALPIWGAAALATIVLKRRDRIDATQLLLATSLGFAAVFMLQRKGWPYHSYPMVALVLFALGHAVVSTRPRSAFDRVFRAGAVALFAILFARSMLWFDVAFDARPLHAAVARLGPNPAILAITAEPGLGHPLVRALDGTWVSRQQGLWVQAYLKHMRQHGLVGPQADRALDGHAARERAMLIEDIHRIRPSVVLLDNLTGEASAWLRAHPEISSRLRDYRLVETINGIDILSSVR
ncbi:hypothetical protein [Bradyrhizobium sp.]|uniref:hypothetical protein n=1 Tax=Bradyrhizobium sp. TaxID=376 RepID=UPI0025C329F3|nr:hypothetical protein [Bradyrhizobium sp.]